jgi:hypothetical protein
METAARGQPHAPHRTTNSLPPLSFIRGGDAGSASCRAVDHANVFLPWTWYVPGEGISFPDPDSCGEVLTV